jgi:hypothetical protein
VLVEEVVAHHKRGTTPALLVAGLRIEAQGDEVSLSGDVPRHLPHLATDRLSPLELARLVMLGDTLHELTQVVPTTDRHRRHDELTVADGYLDSIADVDLDLGKQFVQTQALAPLWTRVIAVHSQLPV